jgi:DNA-binding Xre family transcriptional regulator
MLYLNVKRILDLRGISRPFAHLLNHGFIRSTAHRFVRGDVTQIRLDHLEQLCLLLNCSPNDLFGWRPDKNMKVSENHPLQALGTPKNAPQLSELVKDIPVEKLDKIAELLDQLKN